MRRPASSVVAGAAVRPWEHVLKRQCCCAQLSVWPFCHYYPPHVEKAQLTDTLKGPRSKHSVSGAQRAAAPKLFNEFPPRFLSCCGKSSVEIRALGRIHTKSGKYIHCSKMHERLTPYSHIQTWSDLVFLTNFLHSFFFLFFSVSPMFCFCSSVVVKLQQWSLWT